MTTEIKMYGKTECPYCVKAHNLLRIRELPYEYVSIDTSEALKEEVRHMWSTVGNSIPTVPLIIIDGKIIGGYAELEQLVLTNKI